MRLSIIWVALVILGFVVTAGGVRGDAGFGFSSEERFPILRFDNLADYPDFDFYLLYTHGRGNPHVSPYLTRVPSGEAFRQFEGTGRIGEAYLLAVPHGRPRPSISRGHNWIGTVPAGYLCSAHLDGIHAGRDYLITYRTQIEGDKLEVTMQTGEWLPEEWLLTSPLAPCILVPIAFCATLGWLGVRMARRLFPPKSAQKEMP